MTAKNTSASSKVVSNEQNQTSFKKPMKKFGPMLLFALVVVAGISAVAAFAFYQQLSELKKNPQVIAQNEVLDLIEQVSKLILLPTDEAPTIATVQDPEVLKDQVFFVNAKRGDKVLIYTKARKAILYDPVNNKIVEVAPVNIGNPESVSEVQAPAPAPVEEEDQQP